ncbi:heavy metal-associated domain-containing protein [Lutibacter sp.]|uniref:heavy-metal-associated domain-containing protein n=1 Tax=Lutibacter sp. TaxID=1925666 RepID=UPI001A2EA3B6|nr:heavy metal-associated domain-containing protein [Lutibacter sp.]MBI9040314.1 heavy-metal-associated domain-containing protein [Lutibacter sp.]
MKNLIFLFVFILSFISCTQDKKKPTQENNSTEKTTIAAVYETYEMDIEGMTCEIGCARTIESKLSKTKGVAYSKVDFESKKGVFTIDTNILNEQKVKEKIDGIAGGDLYFVVKSKKINKILK